MQREAAADGPGWELLQVGTFKPVHTLSTRPGLAPGTGLCLFSEGFRTRSAGLRRTKLGTLIQSVSQDIRLDWWFLMAAGSVSISFTRPPLPNPAPSCCRSPICSCAALRGNQDSHT